MSKNNYGVLPQLKDSLYRLISNVGNSLPKGGHDIESLVIKGDQVIINYKARPASLEGALINGQSVTSGGLQVLTLGDGKIKERLNTVYQVKTRSTGALN
jgi:hypothetical protein